MADARNQNQNNPQATQQAGPAQPGTMSRSGPSSPTRPDTPRAMEPRRVGELGQERDWSPFSFMQRFMQDMDRIFEEFPFHRTRGAMMPRYDTAATRGIWSPQIDVFERGDRLVVHADLAGLRQDDIRVTTDEGTLTISGERRHEHEHEAGGVYRCERSYGSFHRSIALPEGVDPESIQANFNNGVLEVTMPMPKPRKPMGRNIPVGDKPGGDGGIKH